MMRPALARLARSVLPEAATREIRRRRVHAKIANYSPRVVEHSYAGHNLRVSLRDPLAEGWYDHDWGTQPELDVLSGGKLRSGARVFDLGAHQGVVALILARIVGDEGSVFAVEAEPHNAAVAAENRDLNGADNLTVVHAAIASTPGTLLFSEGLNGMVLGGGRSGKVRVPATTVDLMAAEHGVPDVVFIDVEGYEAEALLGARETLQAARTDFFVEVHDTATLERVGASVRDVLESFDVGRYTLLAADASREDIGDFRSLDEAVAEPGCRFYLIALSRSDGGRHA
jgi:FkbM family methyltransferase